MASILTIPLPTTNYPFGGQTIAIRRGSTLYYLHADHLGGTALTTTGSGPGTSQAYCAYGKRRYDTTCGSSNGLPTDRHFTGQLYDDTGLHYYAARYSVGEFVEPMMITWASSSRPIRWCRMRRVCWIIIALCMFGVAC
ncbi:MAG: hypothetical protein R3A44_40250 [Caldilineaceae bacterium]